MYRLHPPHMDFFLRRQATSNQWATQDTATQLLSLLSLEQIKDLLDALENVARPVALDPATLHIPEELELTNLERHSAHALFLRDFLQSSNPCAQSLTLTWWLSCGEFLEPLGLSSLYSLGRCFGVPDSGEKVLEILQQIADESGNAVAATANSSVRDTGYLTAVAARWNNTSWTRLGGLLSRVLRKALSEEEYSQLLAVLREVYESAQAQATAIPLDDFFGQGLPPGFSTLHVKEGTLAEEFCMELFQHHSYGNIQSTMVVCRWFGRNEEFKDTEFASALSTFSAAMGSKSPEAKTMVLRLAFGLARSSWNGFHLR